MVEREERGKDEGRKEEGKEETFNREHDWEKRGHLHTI